MIAYTTAPGRGDMDELLYGVAQRLLQRGLRPVGTVQINTDRDHGGPCDMDVQLLPDGATIRISQDLGPHAKGCRLDPDALATAVGFVEQRLGEGADCLIVNKFGKSEADGRGFRRAIGEAMSLGIPVLVGLNQLNSQAFLDFTEGLATEIAPSEEALVTWFLRHLSPAKG